MTLHADDLPDDVAELKRLLIAAQSGLAAKTLEAECQSALNFDPGSASKIDPYGTCTVRL